MQGGLGLRRRLRTQRACMCPLSMNSLSSFLRRRALALGQAPGVNHLRAPTCCVFEFMATIFFKFSLIKFLFGGSFFAREVSSLLTRFYLIDNRFESFVVETVLPCATIYSLLFSCWFEGDKALIDSYLTITSLFCNFSSSTLLYMDDWGVFLKFTFFSRDCCLESMKFTFCF